jgi:hypothetical protein
MHKNALVEGFICTLVGGGNVGYYCLPFDRLFTICKFLNAYWCIWDYPNSVVSQKILTSESNDTARCWRDTCRAMPWPCCYERDFLRPQHGIGCMNWWVACEWRGRGREVWLLSITMQSLTKVVTRSLSAVEWTAVGFCETNKCLLWMRRSRLFWFKKN